MTDTPSVYDERPWTAQYAGHIPATLETPRQPSLAALAAEATAQYADQIAFTTVMPNGMYGSLTYQQVGEMSDAFAVYLREELGLSAGDRVALQMPNCLSYPVALLGTLKAGCVAVNTNPLYTPTEMAHQFKDSGAKVVVIIDLFADKLESILSQTDVKHVVVTRVPEFFPPVVKPIVYGVMKYWNRVIPAHGMKVTSLPDALAKAVLEHLLRSIPQHVLH